MILRIIPSTLADKRPTAYTVEQIGPGLYRYKYIKLIRKRK